jgi:hypothetical protein
MSSLISVFYDDCGLHWEKSRSFAIPLFIFRLLQARILAVSGKSATYVDE